MPELLNSLDVLPDNPSEGKKTQITITRYTRSDEYDEKKWNYDQSTKCVDFSWAGTIAESNRERCFVGRLEICGEGSSVSPPGNSFFKFS